MKLQCNYIVVWDTDDNDATVWSSLHRCHRWQWRAPPPLSPLQVLPVQSPLKASWLLFVPFEIMSPSCCARWRVLQHQWSWQYVYARMCVRINEHTNCRMWTYALNYTCKYVQYTYNIRLRSYWIRTRRITYVHVSIRTYTHVYARIWLQRSRMLGWPEPYVNVFPMNTCRYWHPAGDTDCTYMNVYVRICNYTCIYVQHVYARICNYTCIYVQHVYARIFHRNTVRIFAKHTCTCIRLRCCHGCFMAQVSALSPRGCYGKFVARQRKRMQIAKFNHIDWI